MVACLPKFSLKDAFNPLDEPCEVVIRVRDLNAWDSHVHTRTFWNGANLKGEITKTMEVNDVRGGITTIWELNLHVLLIFGNHIIDFTVKEVLFEVVNKKFLNECLKTKEHHFVLCLEHGLSGSPIGIELGQTLWKHVNVTCFIAVA